MTTLTSSFIFSPLSGLWSSLERHSQIMGYTRAAAELDRLGLSEQASKCRNEIDTLRN